MRIPDKVEVQATRVDGLQCPLILISTSDHKLPNTTTLEDI